MAHEDSQGLSFKESTKTETFDIIKLSANFKTVQVACNKQRFRL